jgi:hypothetical protein
MINKRNYEKICHLVYVISCNGAISSFAFVKKQNQNHLLCQKKRKVNKAQEKQNP